MNVLELYQQFSRETWKPIGDDPNVADALGLVGEVGELASKIYKVHRDSNGVYPDGFKDDIELELGDVLWYLTQIATNFDLTLEDIADANWKKLRDRYSRGVISGNGDYR